MVRDTHSAGCAHPSRRVRGALLLCAVAVGGGVATALHVSAGGYALASVVLGGMVVALAMMTGVAKTTTV
jgi:hypothetical protein